LPTSLPATSRHRRHLAEHPEHFKRSSVPQRAGARSSLTTVDGIGMPGGNAITQGTLRDRVLAAPERPGESAQVAMASGVWDYASELCVRLMVDLRRPRRSDAATGMAVACAGRSPRRARPFTGAGQNDSMTSFLPPSP